MPWIRKMDRMEKMGENIRTMRIATLLDGCARFRKGKNKEGFLSTKIIKLRKESKEERKEKEKRTKRE